MTRTSLLRLTILATTALIPCIQHGSATPLNPVVPGNNNNNILPSNALGERAEAVCTDPFPSIVPNPPHPPFVGGTFPRECKDSAKQLLQFPPGVRRHLDLDAIAPGLTRSQRLFPAPVQPSADDLQDHARHLGRPERPSHLLHPVAGGGFPCVVRPVSLWEGPWAFGGIHTRGAEAGDEIGGCAHQGFGGEEHVESVDTWKWREGGSGQCGIETCD